MSIHVQNAIRAANERHARERRNAQGVTERATSPARPLSPYEKFWAWAYGLAGGALVIFILVSAFLADV